MLQKCFEKCFWLYDNISFHKSGCSLSQKDWFWDVRIAAPSFRIWCWEWNTWLRVHRRRLNDVEDIKEAWRKHVVFLVMSVAGAVTSGNNLDRSVWTVDPSTVEETFVLWICDDVNTAPVPTPFPHISYFWSLVGDNTSDMECIKNTPPYSQDGEINAKVLRNIPLARIELGLVLGLGHKTCYSHGSVVRLCTWPSSFVWRGNSWRM